MANLQPYGRPSDKEFLLWLRLRIVNIYKESPSMDFVRRLEAIANKMDETQTTDWMD